MGRDKKKIEKINDNYQNYRSNNMFRRGVNYACSAYRQRLEQKPLQTKMLTSATLFSLGDFFCQRAEAAFGGARNNISSDCNQNFGKDRSSADGSLTTSPWDYSRTMR